jgi:hypothetical protein
MAFKLPFKLPTFDRRNRAAPPASGGTAAPFVDRRGQGRLPLIGHLDVQTQFRILGSVFLISLLVTIAAIFMQVQATARGTTFLSAAGHIAPLTEQIPKATLAAMQGQKDGFAELRDARDTFGKLLESLLEGGEIKGIRVSATIGDARPALDTLRESWVKQNDIIAQLLAQENRLIAINRLGTEAVQRGPAMLEAADAAGGKLSPLVARILRAATQLAFAPGFDDALGAQLAKDIGAAQELAPPDTPLAQGLKAMQPGISALEGDLKALAQARKAGSTLVVGFRNMAGSAAALLVRLREGRRGDRHFIGRGNPLWLAGTADAGADGQGLQRRRRPPQRRSRAPAPRRGSGEGCDARRHPAPDERDGRPRRRRPDRARHGVRGHHRRHCRLGELHD